MAPNRTNRAGKSGLGMGLLFLVMFVGLGALAWMILTGHYGPSGALPTVPVAVNPAGKQGVPPARQPAQPRQPQQLEDPRFAIGHEAPDIEGEDLDGNKFKLSDYRGKVVVLDFWGHW